MAGAKRQAVADPAARRRACVKTLALMLMLSVFCASLGAEPPAARLAVTAPSAPLPQRLSERDFTSRTRCECARTTSRSRRSTRCGRTAPASAAGSICRPALPSMRRKSMRGNFRSARVCGKNSATTATSRRATSNDWRTVHGASLRTYGTRKARMQCLRRRTVRCPGQRSTWWPLRCSVAQRLPGVS